MSKDLTKQAPAPATDALLECHPLAKIFPLTIGDEFKDLAADIKKNGLHEPITTYQGKILDGRNRYRACFNAKVEPRFETFAGDDAAAAAFVISKNICRRHLTAKRRRELIAKLIKESPEKSNRQIADMTKASPTTVGAVRRETESTVQSGQLPPKRTGKDGKKRKQPAKKATKPIKKEARAAAPPATAAPAPVTSPATASPKLAATSERKDLEQQIAEDRKYARDLVKQDRSAAQWLRAILSNERRRSAVADALAGALKNTETATSGNGGR
jgi:ParB-like chromosome segregation protein Spo0J